MSNLEEKPEQKSKLGDVGNNGQKNKGTSNELTEENLVRLLADLREDKEANEIVENKPFGERILEKKGVFNLLAKKVPLRYIGISSFAQTNKTIMDSYESFKSPICPKCCSAILMYNKRFAYRDGTVDWFCADENCEFTLRYSPKSKEINERIRQLSYSMNANRWDSLSEDEKEELISSHLYRATIYRNIALLFMLFFIAELLLGMWMVSLITGALILSIFVRALAWGYRAFQIKTGKVFDNRIPFTEWLSTSDKWFSVDWVDEIEDLGELDE